MLDQTPTDLLDTAFDVVRRYKSFDSYGSKAAAVRALHRRCSCFSKEQCREALEQALILFDSAAQAYDTHKELLIATWLTPKASEAADNVCAEIQQLCPRFSASTCRSALGWIFYWNYL